MHKYSLVVCVLLEYIDFDMSAYQHAYMNVHTHTHTYAHLQSTYTQVQTYMHTYTHVLACTRARKHIIHMKEKFNEMKGLPYCI